ncbi:MAG: V-type ATP synthase subunit E [Oscillospiraceae bacterium]|nr:V-type ATP synthase subunit E [Oscillospiraceae bacterium]
MYRDNITHGQSKIILWEMTEVDENHESQKLEHLTSVILEEAEHETFEIYDEIDKKSKEALSEAESKTLDEAGRFIKSEISKIHAENGRILSKAVMDNKRTLSLRREAMSDEIMSAVRKKLEEYVQTDKYLDQMEQLAKNFMFELKGGVIFYLREDDEALCKRLSSIGSHSPVEFKTGHFEIGGLEVACHETKRHIDASFDTTLDEINSQFSEMFGLKLG